MPELQSRDRLPGTPGQCGAIWECKGVVAQASIFVGSAGGVFDRRACIWRHEALPAGRLLDGGDILVANGKLATASGRLGIVSSSANIHASPAELNPDTRPQWKFLPEDRFDRNRPPGLRQQDRHGVAFETIHDRFAARYWDADGSGCRPHRLTLPTRQSCGGSIIWLSDLACCTRACSH